TVDETLHAFGSVVERNSGKFPTRMSSAFAIHLDVRVDEPSFDDTLADVGRMIDYAEHELLQRGFDTQTHGSSALLGLRHCPEDPTDLRGARAATIEAARAVALGLRDQVASIAQDRAFISVHLDRALARPHRDGWKIVGGPILQPDRWADR